MRRVAAILGPTASGKTALAVALRERGLPIEVICCDASQMVAGVDAATAKPTAAERAAVPHHLVDAWPLDRPLSAGRYVELALPAIDDVVARGAWPVLVGGTGLYHRALTEGLAPIPPIPTSVRAGLALEAEQRGLAALWAELQAADPTYAAGTPPENRQRVLRALEVLRHTGRPFSAWHATPTQGVVQSCDLVLQPDRARWDRALAVRAEAMVAPLWAEAARLRSAGVPADAPGLAALGYRDAYALLEQHAGTDIIPEDARATLRERLLRSHRAYAKRQRTWFAKLPNALGLDPFADDTVERAAAAVRAVFTEAAAVRESRDRETAPVATLTEEQGIGPQREGDVLHLLPRVRTQQE
ncbi:MAG: hypothetical protein RIT45_1734 [Pseudomonadota bacterium]